MPLALSLSGAQRRTVYALSASIGAGILVMVARLVFGVGAGLPEAVYTQWLTSAGILGAAVLLAWRVIAVADQRGAWVPIAVGVAAYGLGTVLWAFWLERLEEPPFPSPADPLWLLVYPLGFATSVLVLRAQIGRIGMNLWLDGLVGALASAATAGAFLLGPLTAGAEGSVVAVLTNLAYPLGDLLLVAVLVAGLLMSGWRLTTPSLLLAAGFAAFGTADVLYLASVADGDYATVSRPTRCGSPALRCWPWPPGAPSRRCADPSERDA